MKLLHHLLALLFIILLPGLRAAAQDSASTKPRAATCNSGLPKDSAAWERYLRRNVDTLAPVRNGAKKGAYTVVVKFIISKDGYVSDVLPATRHGYGMEEAVMRVVKKAPRWGPVQQESKPALEYHTISFTFVVPKRKLFGRRSQ